MKTRVLLVLMFLVWVQAAGAESWYFKERGLVAGLGYEAKMPDEDAYEGAKLVLEGRYAMETVAGEVDERRQCCVLPSVPTVYRGLLDTEMRFGFDGTGLEYFRVGVTPWAKLWRPGAESESEWRSTRDFLEIGAARYLQDEALQVDGYLEVALGRAGRVVQYRRSLDSPWSFLLGAQASFGWARARSDDPLYSTVSNPYAGIYFDLGAQHDRWGRIYFQSRFVNGFSISNPSRGHPTAREALVRSGYVKRFREDWGIDVYWSKRSFYFDEGGLPSLYTWVRTYGAELTYQFE